MKRLTAILLLFSISSINNYLFSQTYLGLSGGYLFTNPHGNNSSPHTYSDLNYQNSFFVSFDYREIHNKSFALGTSIFYVNQKADIYLRSGGLGGSFSTDATVNYGYLDFYFFPEFYFGKKAQFYLDFGPYFGFNLYSKMSGTSWWRIEGNPPETGSRALSGTANDYLKNIIIGFQVGIGFRYPISEKVQIHVDFSNRIGSVDFDTEGDVKFLTNLIFSAGVNYRMSKRTRPRMNWAHE